MKRLGTLFAQALGAAPAGPSGPRGLRPKQETQPGYVKGGRATFSGPACDPTRQQLRAMERRVAKTLRSREKQAAMRSRRQRRQVLNVKKNRGR